MCLQWQAADNFIGDPIISAHNKHSWTDLLCAQARLGRAGQRVQEKKKALGL